MSRNTWPWRAHDAHHTTPRPVHDRLAHDSTAWSALTRQHVWAALKSVFKTHSVCAGDDRFTGEEIGNTHVVSASIETEDSDWEIQSVNRPIPHVVSASIETEDADSEIKSVDIPYVC